MEKCFFAGSIARHKKESSASTSEQRIYPRKKDLHLALRQFACPFGQQNFVQGDDLGDVSHRLLGETCRSRRQDNVSGCPRPLKIAGQRDADDRCNSAPVHGIALHYHDGSSKPRARSCRHWKISPPNFPLADHHSDFSRMRRDASETKVSFPSSSSQAVFMASVTSSGA